MKQKKTPILLIAFIGILILFTWRNQSYQNFLADFDHATAAKTGLPVLMELGRRTCPDCMAMKPVLRTLKKKYSETFAVSYIDVSANRQIAKEYEITAIPTLIFMDGHGHQLDKKMGRMSEQEILNKWSELGVTAEPK